MIPTTAASIGHTRHETAQTAGVGGAYTKYVTKKKVSDVQHGELREMIYDVPLALSLGICLYWCALFLLSRRVRTSRFALLRVYILVVYLAQQLPVAAGLLYRILLYSIPLGRTPFKGCISGYKGYIATKTNVTVIWCYRPSTSSVSERPSVRVASCGVRVVRTYDIPLRL